MMISALVKSDVNPFIMRLANYAQWSTAREDGNVQIERLRAFGIPTLDDAGAVMLSGWLQGEESEECLSIAQEC